MSLFFHLSSRLVVIDFDEISRLWEKLQLDESNGPVVHIYRPKCLRERDEIDDVVLDWEDFLE